MVREPFGIQTAERSGENHHVGVGVDRRNLDRRCLGARRRRARRSDRYLLLRAPCTPDKVKAYACWSKAFLGLGMIFAMLAIPLALDARWTSALWALESTGNRLCRARYRAGSHRLRQRFRSVERAAGQHAGAGIHARRTADRRTAARRDRRCSCLRRGAARSPRGAET